MITFEIESPQGRHYTVAEYIQEADRLRRFCTRGHVGCAAWILGPCTAGSDQWVEDRIVADRDQIWSIRPERVLCLALRISKIDSEKGA